MTNSCDTRDTGSLPDWELLDRYEAGDATPEEQAQVRAYLVRHPAGEVVLGTLVKALGRMAPANPPGNVRDMLSAAHKRIARSSVLQKLAEHRRHGRLEHAIAALLDAEDGLLTRAEVEELRHVIEAARDEGR